MMIGCELIFIPTDNGKIEYLLCPFFLKSLTFQPTIFSPMTWKTFNPRPRPKVLFFLHKS